MSNLSRRRLLRLSLAAGGAVLLPFSGTSRPVGRVRDTITRNIPSTGEKIPAIGMGTWRTFDEPAGARDHLRQVLSTFADRGGRVIDSSPMYGHSEAAVGDLAAELGLEKHFFLATKVWTTGREAGVGQMRDSLRKMGREPMDLMQVHNLVDLQTHLRTLREWKEEGRIRYLGATHYQIGAHDDLADLVKTGMLDFIQVNFSVGTRAAEDYLLPLARDKGVAVMINRPFEEGALFRRIGGKKLPPWAADYDIRNWAQFFLKYIISHPAVTCAIPATSQAVHMEENMGAAYGPLPDEKTRRKMAEWWEEK